MKNDPFASDYKLKDYNSSDYKNIEDSSSSRKKSDKKEKVVEKKSKLKIADKNNWLEQNKHSESIPEEPVEPNVVVTTKHSGTENDRKTAPEKNPAGKIKIVETERTEYEPNPSSFGVTDDDEEDREEMVMESPFDILIEKLKTLEKPPKYYLGRGGMILAGLIVLFLIFGPFGLIILGFILYHMYYKNNKNNDSMN